MEYYNIILASFFGLIALGSFIGVLVGAPDQAFLCLFAISMIIMLLADNQKKATV